MKFLVLLVITLNLVFQVYSSKTKLEQLEKDLRQNFDNMVNQSNNKKETILETDQNTFANIGEARIIRYDLELEIDFEEEKLQGFVVIEAESLKELKQLVLDAWKLKINGDVKLSIPEPYEIPIDDVTNEDWQDNIEESKLYGGSIIIPFDKYVESYVRDKDGEIVQPEQKIKGPMPAFTLFFVTIPFETVNNYQGIGDTENTPARYSFIKAENTHGKKAPFFYTQNTPIYARTIFPCWDTPQSWTELNMKIKVKKELGLSIYSHQPKNEQTTEGDYTVATFSQQYPKITTHQIAIVAGKLEEKKLSDQVYILSDDGEVNDKAADLLKHVSEWIEVTETIVGLSYAWDRFELVIMPPNYPYEGSQNQQLTYISPTVLNSGRTGASVVMHEIASNYFGNVVQACNWQNLWINEGISTYIERVTKSQFYGGDYNEIDQIIGNYTLFETFQVIDQFKLDSSYKSLHPITKNTNPDDIINEVPFEKGYQFLMYLEQLLQFPREVCLLLQDFITEYEFKSVDHLIFQDFTTAWINNKLGEKDGEEINDQIDWLEWITGEGFPPKDTLEKFESQEYDLAIDMANKFIQFDGTARPHNYKDLETWDDDQQYAFLDFFIKHTFMVNNRLVKQLDMCYDFKSSSNLNILYRWLTLSSLHRYNSAENLEILNNFMKTTGRIKFIIPVYEALAKSGQTDKADKYLIQQKDFYHHVAIEAIESAIFRTTM